MNATLAAQRSESVALEGLGLRRTLAGWLWALRVRVAGMSRLQRALAIAALAGLVVAAAGVVAGPRLMGYFGVFGFSVAANATLFLPSGRGAVMLAGALVLNPMAVAVLTGVGGAIGEITGYALGRSSRKLVKPKKAPGWLERTAQRHMALSVLAVSIIPNPFVDLIGIIAGRLGYPLRLFLGYSIIGKVVQSIAIVYLALWNLHLISSWLDVGA